MASASLKIYELIDLAVGVPNVNSINLSVLHTVLQLVATQIGIQNLKIDFEGEDAKRVKELRDHTQTAAAKLVNYSVTEKDTKDGESPAAQKKMLQAEAKQPVKMVEFRRLENKVRMIATHVEAITMLPNTDELIEQMRTNPNTTPISEMLHNVALTKRVSAVEEGVDKFASILERIYKDQNRIRQAFKTQFPNIVIDSSDIELRSSGSGNTGVDAPPAGGSRTMAANISGELNELEELDSSPELKAFLNHLAMKMDNLEAAFEEQKEMVETRRVAPSEDVKHSLVPTDYVGAAASGASRGSESSVSNKRIFFIEKICQSNEAKIKNVDQSFKIELLGLQEQLRLHETELNLWIEKLTECFGEDFLTSGKRPSTLSGPRDSVVMSEVTVAISTLQQEITEMASSLQNLVVDHEKKNDSLRKLKLAVEKMDNTKLDKEFLEDTLAGKADTILVNRKVSYEQFDVTCNELNGTLNSTLKRLNDQESQWGTVIEEIHTAIKNKLDRNEISPLKEFLNYRLKILQEKIKSILADKLESEGAGTKKQLMKDLRCISCDKSVMQRTDKTARKGVEQFPMNKSVKPYLTYELDQIRRQEKQLPLSRNLNEFNRVLKDAASRSARFLNESGDKIDHLCNRYCGGSHTQTSAVQRVSKAGHFSEKWSLQVLPYAQKTEDQKPPEKAKEKTESLSLPAEQEKK